MWGVRAHAGRGVADDDPRAAAQCRQLQSAPSDCGWRHCAAAQSTRRAQNERGAHRRSTNINCNPVANNIATQQQTSETECSLAALAAIFTAAQASRGSLESIKLYWGAPPPQGAAYLHAALSGATAVSTYAAQLPPPRSGGRIFAQVSSYLLCVLKRHAQTEMTPNTSTG